MAETEITIASIIEEIRNRRNDNHIRRFHNDSCDPSNPWILRESEFLLGIVEKLEELIKIGMTKPKIIENPNLLPIIEISNRIPERLESILALRGLPNDNHEYETTLKDELKFLEETLSILGQLKNSPNKSNLQPAKQTIQTSKRGFLLLAENGTHPPKYEHETIEEAHQEAQRLAILTRGYVNILHKTAVVCPDFSVVLNTKTYDSSVIESSKIEKELTKHDDLPF